MPLVICIALGSNMGNRGKDGQTGNLSGYCIQKAEKMQCGSGRKRGECKTSFSWKNTAGHGVRIGGSLGGGKYAGLFH